VVKKLIFKLMPLIDILLIPFVFAAGFILFIFRRAGAQRLKKCRETLIKIGIFPIRDHYYEPLFNPKELRYSLRDDRYLPGIDLNIDVQLELLNKLDFNDELLSIPIDKKDELQFYYNNMSFPPGDSEYYYSLIRLFKPKKIIEIGAGYTSLMAIEAINQNKRDKDNYSCELILIEPYEMKWINNLDANVIINKVENVNSAIFNSLGENDILFIDSSHIIRPQGDVLFEYLEVIPCLKKGVLIHIHDIFTPKDYSNHWVLDEVLFWNEQYLLEAFLSFNNDFKVIAALNFLYHNYFNTLAGKCPILQEQSHKEPRSFWLIRN
jgi:hypothetical protein